MHNNLVIEHGDSRNLCAAIPDGSIDFIFTDPPYIKKFLGTYQWLGQEAPRLLKPGGYLIAYCLQRYVDKIMDYFKPNLRYFWTSASFHKGGKSGMYPDVGIVNQWKPLLIYSNGKPGPHKVFNDATYYKPSKIYHDWGQSEECAAYYIGNFTSVGDIVLDPFCGGGTTAYASLQLGRSCITFDIDPLAVEVARNRLSKIQAILLHQEEFASELWTQVEMDY